jgi:hypothetical protein
MMRNFFQRSSFLNVAGEKGNRSAKAYDDGDGKPDEALKWPANAILFPHSDHGNEKYAEKYSQ